MRSGQPVLASFLYVKRNYETISEKVPIRVKSWPNDKLAVGSNSNGIKWSIKFTKKSSWQTLREKMEAISQSIKTNIQKLLLFTKTIAIEENKDNN